jgi:hypothetical protein
MDMNLVFGNTFIVLGDNPIPLKKLKVANQVIVFNEEHQVRDIEEEILINTTKHMVLSDIKMNSLYTFSCMDIGATIDVYQTEPKTVEDGEFEEEGTFYIDSAYVDNDKEYNEGYLIIGEKTLKIDTTRSIYTMYDENINTTATEYKSSDYKLVKSIYDRVLIEYGNRHNWLTTINDSNKSIAYYAHPLNDDTSLILVKSHELDPKIRSWHIHEDIFLINKAGMVVELNYEISKVLNIIEGSSYVDSDFQKFKRICQFDNYTIDKYLKDKSLMCDIINFFQFNDKIWGTIYGMEVYYKPIYEQDGVKAYITKPSQKYNKELSFIYNNEFINRWSNKYEEIDINSHGRVASNVLSFINDRFNGINPKDGFRYKDNVLLEEDPTIVYKDAEMIEFKIAGRSTGYYGLIKNYFVVLNDHNDEDKLIIKDGLERKLVMQKLRGEVI